ncbi:hypothetical protein ACFQE5_08580 [Pseudonocardia hispaniensis]|uniref:Gluconate 2-dehydrogenase subunit 3-like protein n=1 Tax=Pseudonocardia hispaniensis TaxID=904933 RepID=A0ABW1J1C5_9PSEU
MNGLLSDQQRRTLVDLLRTAFPHDGFPVGAYQRTADAVLAKAADAPRLLAQLVQGLSDVDQLRGVAFSQLDAETATAVVRGIADTPFFAGIVEVAVVALYDDREVWDVLGYEGPSFDKGGYLNRGFNDLDWLPEPRIEEAEGVSA